MQLTTRKINKDTANLILDWQYQAPYDFYNNENNEETRSEFLDGSYQAVFTDSGELFGFFCTGPNAQIPVAGKLGLYRESMIDVGLGMNPFYAGSGHGYAFCSFILQCIRKQNKKLPLRLSVATFNKRAIHLYEQLGFAEQHSFNTDAATFITMVKV
ncbi:GNAT family N-acetyltransferase [Gracilibacillus caseinilyticus]|uniref:GNAT family N-acetyltransferase n=1 Tax=Gracilibacillus caseinilyticus TaxID=2932256 RepID=A0ABY4EWY7_9BACI|nr:GNAT family protein [Gracilibacillus caseinilyticus]UOQ48940.1 GNAT family N-acetyltransferase [Gracilibacillus caseinilyticus]